MEKKLNLAKCTFIYLTCAVLFLLLKIFSELKLFNFLGEHRRIYVNAFLQIVIMMLIPAILYCTMHKRSPKKMFKDFQFNRVSWKAVLLSFAAGFAMYLCVIIISSTASGFWSMLGYKNPFKSYDESFTNAWGLLILPLFTGAVLPGFCEEFINRGMLQNSLQKLSPRHAILFSALLFALLHYNINQAVYAFFVGLLLGAITYFAKSIWPAIIMHFTNNFCSTFFDYADKQKIFGKQFNSLLNGIFEGHVAFVIFKFILFAAVSFSALAYLVYMLHKQTRGNRLSHDLSLAAKELMGGGVKTENGTKYESKNADENYQGETLVKLKEAVVQSVVTELSSKKSYLERFVPYQKPNYASPLEKVFLFSAIVLSAALTFFTLLWGFI